ncbi:MAG TPA: MarR family transcriptional regulator [Dehalococcoidia bacterium]|nr:MarR family transcriptional regulator [Dehalococcoidia bacterium]
MKQGDTERLVRQILQRAEDIYNMFSPGIPVEWFSSDLTVAQLRVLLVLQSSGASRMSDIASILDVALPTATGIVDKLVKKELVIREADLQDRRLVICRLSDAGQELINRLWTFGQFQMERLLNGLTEEELEKAAEVAEILFDNLTSNK